MTDVTGSQRSVRDALEGDVLGSHALAVLKWNIMMSVLIRADGSGKRH